VDKKRRRLEWRKDSTPTFVWEIGGVLNKVKGKASKQGPLQRDSVHYDRSPSVQVCATVTWLAEKTLPACIEGKQGLRLEEKGGERRRKSLAGAIMARCWPPPATGMIGFVSR
jgi:hypothetical protein